MKTYLSISIVHYSNRRIAPDVHYYKDDGVHPTTSTFNELSTDEANKLMWELVKLGAKNAYSANMLNNAISERRVTFWGEL